MFYLVASFSFFESMQAQYSRSIEIILFRLTDANGSGWWDSNMEGVDNDEVGCHEMWEGVGSTTLGGLEWN